VKNHTTRAKAHAGLAKHWGGDGTGIGVGKTMKAASRKIALAHGRKSVQHHMKAARNRGSKK